MAFLVTSLSPHYIIITFNLCDCAVRSSIAWFSFLHVHRSCSTAHVLCMYISAAVYHFSALHLQRHCSDKSNVLVLSIIISYFSYYSMSAVVTAAAITYRNQSAVLFKQLPIAPTSTRESFFIHFLILQPHQIQTYSLTISHQVSSVTRSNQSR
jgi:hypothetical protein